MKLSSLSQTDKIKLAAEMDGEMFPECGCSLCIKEAGLDYDYSYDAIIPLIQKQTDDIQWAVFSVLANLVHDDKPSYLGTPSNYLDALLVASEKCEL